MVIIVSFTFIVNILVLKDSYTVEPLITVTSAQRPPSDLRSVKKFPAEFKVKLS